MLVFTQGAGAWTLSWSSGQLRATDFRQEKMVTLAVHISAGGCAQHMHDKVMLTHDKQVIKKAQRAHLTQVGRESLSTSAAVHRLIVSSRFLCFGRLSSWISINMTT